MLLRTPLLLLLTVFSLTAKLYAQPYPEAIEVLHRYELRPGVRVTALVRDLQTGEVILAHRTSEAFRPASLVKIATTGAFLALRGQDYRFHTPIILRGQVEGETLHGDLVLKASADPSLGSHYIPNQKRLISEVKALLDARGISRITGGLVWDLHEFPRPFTNETWPDEDLDEYYGAPIAGLNVADNYADLYLFSSDEDSPVAETNIASLLIPTRQELVRSGSTQLDLTPTFRPDTLLISGTIRERLSGRHLRWTMPDPPSYTSIWLNEGLRLEGINLQQRPTLSYDEPLTGKLDTIGYYTSLPADTLIKITNFRSSNIYAEGFAYALNNYEQRKTGQPSVMRSYWRERLGLTPDEFYPMDGSGLSPEGRLSSGSLSLILSELWRDQALHKPFLASLPEAGVEGTVRSLSTPSSVTAYLKSGSMRGVRGYAGYLNHEDKWYSIVYIANGSINSAEAKATFSQLLTRLFTNQPLPSTPITVKQTFHKEKKSKLHSNKKHTNSAEKHHSSKRKGKKR